MGNKSTPPLKVSSEAEDEETREETEGKFIRDHLIKILNPKKFHSAKKIKEILQDNYPRLFTPSDIPDPPKAVHKAQLRELLF